jgi:hypothetical protein
MAEAVTQQVGSARPGLRPLVVWWPPSPSPSRLLAPWVFWWNRIFAIFSQIFTESWISAQKWDTRAILLKTVLVRVSCIQNTQIRGETIAKVFGKVDTFWTYHCVQVPRCCWCKAKPWTRRLINCLELSRSLAFSYWFDKPWFHNWGKTCCCAHHTFLLGFPTGCNLYAIRWMPVSKEY